ncbi:hypothetical protein DBADOPDK_06239 [Pseudomonas sp. MM223]|nr:hypothetical protein DBADOPDK_06239 [Pseudomonas sp. MM223]
MPAHDFVSPDSIRAQFSAAMSLMYKQEVPLYGTLLELVSEINQQVMAQQPQVAEALRWTGEIERLDHERHGAIRVGTAEELATIARLFAVMGMQPVGYYDLVSPACRCIPRLSARCRSSRCTSARSVCSPRCCAWS